MNSTWLIVAGVVGLVISGAARLAPYIKARWKTKSTSGNLHALVDAYAVLHEALIDNEATDEADHLRSITFPAAINRR